MLLLFGKEFVEIKKLISNIMSFNFMYILKILINWRR